MSLSIISAARHAPHAEALVCDGVRLSFSALAARVRARRGELAALGVEPLDARPVALIVDGSLAMFEFLYLCFELGVPLLPLHPRLTAPEREYLVSSSSAQCTIDPSQTEPVGETPAPAWDFPAVPDERILAWVPSSGSTGRPKLVALSRRAFLALSRADALRVPPQTGDRALLCLPLSHVGGLSVVTRSLSARRCCVAFRAGSGGLLGCVPKVDRTGRVARTRLAFVALARGDAAGALSTANAVLAREPQYVEAMVVKAKAQVARKEWDAALTTLAAALHADEKNEAAVYLRGRIHASRRNYDDAARDFQLATQLNPRASAAYMALARVELARGRVPAAMEQAQAAVAAGGGVPARLVLADAYAVEGRLADADRELGVAVAQAPNSAVVQAQVARLRLAQGREAPARAALATALTIDPTSPAALASLTQLDLRAGRAAAARARLQKAVDTHPKDARLWLLLGRLAFATGDSSGAERALRQAVTEDPDSIDAYGLLAHIYALRGELASAERELEAIVQRHPRPLAARIMLGVNTRRRRGTWRDPKADQQPR